MELTAPKTFTLRGVGPQVCLPLIGFATQLVDPGTGWPPLRTEPLLSFCEAGMCSARFVGRGRDSNGRSGSNPTFPETKNLQRGGKGQINVDKPMSLYTNLQPQNDVKPARASLLLGKCRTLCSKVKIMFTFAA